MNRLQDLEEWKAIRAIQPFVKRILEIAMRDPQSRSFSYFNSLENLKLELDQVPYIDSQISFSPDALTGDVEPRLNLVLTVLENLADENLILHPVTESQIPNTSFESHLSVTPRVLNNYPNLRRLVQPTPYTGVSIRHSESKKNKWDVAAGVIADTNKFLESDSQPHDPLFAKTGTKTVPEKVDNRIHNFVSTILEGVQTKLSECQNQASHDTLFTISGLESLGDETSVLHLDLLFKSCATPHEAWQEASCHYGSSPTARGGLEFHLIQPLGNLCETIEQSLRYSEHLHLGLEDQRVVHCDLPNRETDLRGTRRCRSLGDLLDNNCFRPLGVTSSGLTSWEKRTLALQLSHLFLHLYDCEWAANRWTTSGVHFAFSEQPQKILESPPYLKCNEYNERKHEKKTSKLLALAKLLIEIELGEEIKEVKFNILKEPSWLSTLTDILHQGRMQSSRFYVEAVEHCLNLAKGPKTLELMKNHILEKIVKNLQAELDMMRRPKRNISPILSSNIRSRKAIRSEQSFPLRKKRRHRSSGYLTERRSSYSGIWKKRRKKSWSDQRQARREYASEKGSHLSPGSSIQGSIRLFDESDSHSQDGHMKASAEEFVELYAQFRKAVTNNIELSQRIKVCVIDTGLDERHPAIQAAKTFKAIKERRSFMGQPNDTKDYSGHGTHMVELILKSSANVEIYVAKIADDASVPQDEMGIIADAINHAVKEWKVDIITMSFGFRDRNEGIVKAIKEADHCGTLLFAAAANHGGNGPRTWPAQDPRVICINASDGKGKDGGISPTAVGHGDDFMTLGISVPLFWKGAKIHKSGTSYATPIAVGIAINVLEICSSSSEAVKLLKEHENMRRVFRLFSSMDNGYMYIAPWILWNKCRDLHHMRLDIASQFY
ncbi:hypothetical protein E8E14_013091 [Neopestalotiopsis sp. 37M]|nr:hypothetical protein E8E14_013091 [Neopestalotiopsis sp. 37M]